MCIRSVSVWTRGCKIHGRTAKRFDLFHRSHRLGTRQLGYAAFASGKFGLRGLAQSMARELAPKNIHVAHLIIDAGVDTEFVRDRLRKAGTDPDHMPPDTLMNPAALPKPIGTCITNSVMAGPTNWTSVLTPKNGEIDRHSFRQRLCFYLNKSTGFGYAIYLDFRANILSVKSTWTIIKSGLMISPIGFIFLAILAG